MDGAYSTYQNQIHIIYCSSVRRGKVLQLRDQSLIIGKGGGIKTVGGTSKDLLLKGGGGRKSFNHAVGGEGTARFGVVSTCHGSLKF